jgi:AcrR family transcriptional regulator
VSRKTGATTAAATIDEKTNATNRLACRPRPLIFDLPLSLYTTVCRGQRQARRRISTVVERLPRRSNRPWISGRDSGVPKGLRPCDTSSKLVLRLFGTAPFCHRTTTRVANALPDAGPRFRSLTRWSDDVNSLPRVVATAESLLRDRTGGGVVRRLPKVHDARERLLDAAIELFATKGFASTGVSDITDYAGLTRSAFYYYFSSKSDLAADLQHKLWNEAAERAMAVFDPSLDTVTNMKRAFAAHLSGLAELGRAGDFLYTSFVDTTLEESSVNERRRGFELLKDLVTEAMKSGEVVHLDPSILADFLTELFEVSTRNVLRSENPAAATAVVSSLLDGLVPAQAATRGQRQLSA